MNQLIRKDDIVIEEVQKKLNEHIAAEVHQRDELMREIIAIKDATAELVEAWNNAKGAIAVIRVAGNVVKWAAPIIAAMAAYWAVLKGKYLP